MRPIKFSSSKNVLYICLTQPGLCFLMVSSTCFPLSSNFFSSLSTSSKPSWISWAINNLILVDCLYSVTGLSVLASFFRSRSSVTSAEEAKSIVSSASTNLEKNKANVRQFACLRVQSNPYQLQCCQKQDFAFYSFCSTIS